jgi:glycosyltransferase involved in cell wall biosynthesis
VRVSFYSPNRIEPWSYRNLEIGIGGSETSHIELSWRLAEKGHDVVSYTALPDGDGGEWRGVDWRDLSDADLREPGLWIVYRHPPTFDVFEPAPDRRAWLVCQDVYYPDWVESVAKADKIMALCTTHRSYLLNQAPYIADRLVLSSNGVRTDLIESLEPVKRNPKGLIYSSSPDRGLVSLLDIFERAREYDDELELHVFYGLDNIEMIAEKHGDRRPWQASFDARDRAKSMPGVTWHGRVGQRQLYQEFMKSAMWVYPTDFTETSCISCMEAQAMGAIPITRPYWATLDNVKHGIFIQGSPGGDPLVRARYVDAILQVANSTEGQEAIRSEMMPEARHRCDWQRVAEQWDDWIRHPPSKSSRQRDRENTWLFGVRAVQYATDTVLWHKLFTDHPNIKNIVELGTGWGGLSLLFAVYAEQLGAEFRTYDTGEIPYRFVGSPDSPMAYDTPLGARYRESFVHGDIFGDRHDEIVELIQNPGQSLIFCDNGNKPLEVQEFSKHAKPGDIIAVHDWLEEIRPEDIPEDLTQIMVKDTKESRAATAFFVKEGGNDALR